MNLLCKVFFYYFFNNKLAFLYFFVWCIKGIILKWYLKSFELKFKKYLFNYSFICSFVAERFFVFLLFLFN